VDYAIIRAMEIGCHLPTTQEPAATRDARLAFARDAEKRDIASRWVSDHVVIPRVNTGYARRTEYKRPGLSHVLVEFRRPEHGRMMELLGLLTETIRPAVDAA
jgi:hypothetical protein